METLGKKVKRITLEMRRQKLRIYKKRDGYNGRRDDNLWGQRGLELEGEVE